MKLYCFYKYDKSMTKEQYMEKIENNISQEDIYPLYAMTTNKSFKKRFMKERDMNKFILITKDDDKEQIVSFMNQKRSSVLDLFSYAYVIDNKKEIKVKVLSTYEEYNSTMMLSEEGVAVIDEIFELKFSNPYILKEQYLTALKRLDYDALLKFQYVKDMNNSYVNVGGDQTIYREVIPVDEGMPETPNIILDEFNIFLHLCGHLFK